jgi:hypothetical protein
MEELDVVPSASAMAQADKSKQTGKDMETKASKVLQSDKYSDETKNVPLEIEGKFEMLPNNALIFQGTDKFHWREECIHDHFITVFLHYVDQNGDFSNHKFDKRTMLGQPKTK